MDIVYSGRHLDVTNDLKDYSDKKLQPVIDNKNLKITSVKVVLSMEKNRQKAEIIINMKHLNVEADAETYDMYESIDKAVDKVDHQITRFLDKKQDHKTNRIPIREVESAVKTDEPVEIE